VIHHTCKVSLSFVAGVVLCLASHMADAQLLVDPTGGTTLSFNNTDDGVVTGRTLGFAGQFFGTAKTTVDVTTNGNLNFSGDTDFHNTSMPLGVSRISPLWDDLDISTNNAKVIEKSSAGSYYSVTWQNVSSRNFDGTDTFQVVWFGAPTNINSFNFLPGDFAFAYSNLDAGFRTGGASNDPGATVGLDKGDNSTFSSLPGDADGLITDSQKNLLPVNNGQFLLFRPNGLGGYTTSLQPAAVPEPGGVALWTSMLGTGAFLLRRRRK
jgi:hypothetical protein